jgi:hypothetical protein
MKIDIFGSYLQSQAAFQKKAREPRPANHGLRSPSHAR